VSTTAERSLVSATLSVSEARRDLLQLPERLEKEDVSALAVTRHGEPVLAIMPWALFESITETLEILGDEKLMAALRKSIEAIKAGRTYTSEQARQKLGL